MTTIDTELQARADRPAPAQRRTQTAVLLVLVLAIALGARLGGITFGLPYVYHPDEPAIVDRARHMADSGDLNPHWFNYPPLYTYAQAGLIWAAARIRDLVGASPPGELALQGSTYLLGRALTATLGTATVYLVFLAGRALVAPAAGLAASAVLALSFAHVQNSQYITTDVPAAFFVSLSLYASIRGLRGSRGWAIAGGAAAGLAAATKYNAGLCLLLPLALWPVAPGRPRRLTSDMATLFAAGSAAALAFLLAVPWVLLDTRTVWDGIAFEIQHYRTGHAGFEGADNWRFYALYLWRTGLTPALSLLVVLGWAAVVKKRVRQGLALSVFPAAYYVLLASQRVRFERNLMPVMPVLALFAGCGLAYLASRAWPRMPRPWLRPLALLAALVALFAWPAWRIGVYDYFMRQPDTRTITARWIEANLPPGSRICLEAYSPPVSPERFALAATWTLSSQSLASLREDGCQFVVASSKMYGRYIANSLSYPDEAAFYEELFATWPLVARFTGHELDVHAPEIRVYRVPE